MLLFVNGGCMKKSVSFLVGAALIAVMGIDCKSPTSPTIAKPTLPSEKSMTMPTFVSADSKLAKSGATHTQVAVTLARAVVVYWTVTANLALLVPRTLFVLTLSLGQPTALSDNSGWQWKVNNNQGDTARLTGQVKNDSVRWNMYVTNKTFKDFLWFSGASTITGNSGYWIFNDSTNAAALKFTYNRMDLDTGSVKVEVVKSGDHAFGSSLQWSALGDTRSFIAFDNNTQANGKAPITYIITWSFQTEAGSISVPKTSEHYCWDTKANGHIDIPCN
jgi:hypothetical protein